MSYIQSVGASGSLCVGLLPLCEKNFPKKAHKFVLEEKK